MQQAGEGVHPLFAVEQLLERGGRQLDVALHGHRLAIEVGAQVHQLQRGATLEHLVQRLLDRLLFHALAAGGLQRLIAFQIQPLQIEGQLALGQRQVVGLVLQIEGVHLHLVAAGEGLGIISRQLGFGGQPLQGDLDAVRQLYRQRGEGHVAAGREPDAADLGHVGTALELGQHHVHLVLLFMHRHALPVEGDVTIAFQIAVIVALHRQEVELVEPLLDLELVGPEAAAVAGGPQAADRLDAELPLLHLEGVEHRRQRTLLGVEQHVALDVERQDAAGDDELRLDRLAPLQLTIQAGQGLRGDHHLQHAIAGEQVARARLPAQFDAALLLHLGDLLGHDAIERVARVPAGTQPTHHQGRRDGQRYSLLHLLLFLQGVIAALYGASLGLGKRNSAPAAIK